MRDGRTVVLAPTAPGDPLIGPISAEQARERAAGLGPQPYAPDRKALAETLGRELGGKTDYSVVWLSDGLDYGEGVGAPRSPCQARRVLWQRRHAAARAR